MSSTSEKISRRRSRSSWKMIFDKILLPIGGRFILQCNFDTAKLRVPLPAYCKECLDAWSELNNIMPSSSHEVVNETIWNNKTKRCNRAS